MRTLFAILWQLLRMVRWFLMVFLGYLLQMCIMPYFEVFDVVPSLLFVLTGIITVCYGRLRAYWTGAVYGILMETMMPSITFLNLVFYPIASSLAAVPFADKTETQREADRTLNRDTGNGNVYLRSASCATMIALLNEVINIVYIYLGGTALEFLHFQRCFVALASTFALTLALTLPVRVLLGFHHIRRKKKETHGRYID